MSPTFLSSPGRTPSSGSATSPPCGRPSSDAETIARIDGRPAITLAVKKRIGANVVETIEGSKKVAEEFVAQSKQALPDLQVSYTQDKSVFVNQLLNDLQNHVMIAVILVFIVILYALSGRASMLIGLGHPVLFLIGILLLALMGYTINMIVLFSLILAVGMLVDDAIIVTEYAERRMSEGMPKEQAFEEAAKRMAGPVIAATLTRIAAFSPLLFLAGHRRRLHEIPADHADRDARRIDGLCADLRSGDRRNDRQGAAARRARKPRRALHGRRQEGRDLPDPPRSC